jgi:toxin ParE1/3/4
MSALSFSLLAIADLEGIARDKPLAALAFVETLKEKFHTLARFPLLGASGEELIPGLRAFPVGNYIIYYRPESDGARIERVLHGARDSNVFPR